MGDKVLIGTRELFLPAGMGQVTPTSYYDHLVVSLPDAATTMVNFEMLVPVGFLTFTSVKAVWECETGGTNNMNWQLTAAYGAAGEALDNHIQVPAAGKWVSVGAVVISSPHVQIAISC